MSDQYTYHHHERRPVEVLVFQMDPEVVEEFIAVDHEVWTLGEAHTPGLETIPFLSKEVWLDDAHPGQVTIVFVWENQALWNIVGQQDFQHRLQQTFDEKFPYPVTLVAALHEESNYGIHRVSRFERRQQSP